MLGQGKSSQQGIGDSFLVQSLYQSLQSVVQLSSAGKVSTCLAEHSISTLSQQALVGYSLLFHPALPYLPDYP